VLKEPGEPVLIYCHHGVRSLHAAEWLAGQGFSRVRSLAGGIDGWARVYEPGMRRY
jgi:rhodanese-related sulfurtransferase